MIVQVFILGGFLTGLALWSLTAAASQLPEVNVIFPTRTQQAIQPFSSSSSPSLALAVATMLPHIPPPPPPELTWWQEAFNDLVVFVGGPVNAQIILFVLVVAGVLNEVFIYARNRNRESGLEEQAD